MLKTPQTYSEKAKELFLDGYNCAQSVFCAFAQDYGFDFDTALKLSSSFGGGMGRMREVCGAVSSMFLIAGLEIGYTSPDDDETKAQHYARIQELANKFKSKYSTILCRNLLNLKVDENYNESPIPEARTPKYYKERPCAEIVSDAAFLIADYIKKHK